MWPGSSTRLFRLFWYDFKSMLNLMCIVAPTHNIQALQEGLFSAPPCDHDGGPRSPKYRMVRSTPSRQEGHRCSMVPSLAGSSDGRTCITMKDHIASK
jgi:hypothetical protein